MKIENENDPFAKVAKVSNTNEGINKIPVDVASLLASISKLEHRDRRRKEYEERMQSMEKLFDMSREQIELWENQGVVFTEIGTTHWASKFQGYQYRTYEAKRKMKIKVCKATQKLTERILDIGLECDAYIQIYRDEGVSLLIRPKSETVLPELYKYGECNGYVVYSNSMCCSREDFKGCKVYDCADFVISDVSSVIEDFKLVEDPPDMTNLNLGKYDDEGNEIISDAYDDIPY